MNPHPSTRITDRFIDFQINKMGEKFSYLYDFPQNFYYGDLRTALGDLKLTNGGIAQIIAAQPLTDEGDRKAIMGILTRVVADSQRPAEVIDLVWEHTLVRLKALGFSAKGLREMEQNQGFSGPEDRKVLLAVLSHWLVRNEMQVPRGYPAHLKALWKRKQLEMHSPPAKT